MLTSSHCVFVILNALRHGVPSHELWKEFRRLGCRLKPRLTFWLSLCRQAHLITETVPPHPTSLSRRWLSWPSDAQASHLLEAWQSCPRNRKDRAARKGLLKRLVSNQPLNQRDLRELPGLEALGFCSGYRLTGWGRVALGLLPAPMPVVPLPWWVDGRHLIVHFPPDWNLLWELERFLSPAAPGIYPLDDLSLRKAIQRGPAEKLIAVLEKGIAGPLSAGLRTRILGLPTLRILQGSVLEFSHPAELQRIRRLAGMRQYFDSILSPRHLWVESSNISRLLSLLERRGIYAHPLEPETEEVESSNRQPRFRSAPPAGMERAPLLTVLQAYLHRQQALDILYYAPNRAQPELRRITPLLIEERGGQTYLSAYCHTRRANRTFRLDRIEIPAVSSAG